MWHPEGEYCHSKTRRFWPWRSISSANFATLSPNEGQSHFVGKFIVDTPPEREHLAMALQINWFLFTTSLNIHIKKISVLSVPPI